MRHLGVVVAFSVFLMLPTAMLSQYVAPTALSVDKDPKGKDETRHIGLHGLRGSLVDHTRNHGKDNRIWSRAMFEWRDLYIYLPPGYDPRQQYPIMLFMHPFSADERFFLSVVPLIDDAIVKGKMPPIIVAAPDGSLDGTGGSFTKPGSFFLNSGAGSYEDFLFQDVWDFVTQRYPIRPERCAHVLAGASMGGHAAFNLALRHRQCFGAVIGIHPPLNMRWADVDGNPRAKFDPRRWGWRTGFDNPKEIMATYFGTATIRTANVIQPVFGVGEEALVNIACNNPLELLIKTRYQNGELAMFVGYAGRDEFNIDAQVESFLYYAKFKGIGVAVAFEPDGRHDAFTMLRLFPSAFEWLGPLIAPYAPPGPPVFHPRFPAPAEIPPAPSIDTRWPAPAKIPPPGPPPPFNPIWPATKEIPPPPPRQPIAPRWPASAEIPPPRVQPIAPMRWPGLGI